MVAFSGWLLSPDTFFVVFDAFLAFYYKMLQPPLYFSYLRFGISSFSKKLWFLLVPLSDFFSSVTLAKPLSLLTFHGDNDAHDGEFFFLYLFIYDGAFFL